MRKWGFFVVLVLSFWAIKPLFIPGFFPMHDDTQVARVYEMGKALKDGMFPVRWVADLGYGYGYPIFNFYSPLPYYVGGFFNLIGFDALVATKLMFALGILLSGIFMYFLTRELGGEIGGIVSGLFYLYAPYHAVDIYVRGDVAEFWAYAFIPLMFLGFYKVFQNKDVWKWISVGAIGYAGVILSHNLTAMMVTPFLIITLLPYCYITYKNKKLFTIYYLLFTIFLGLLLSAFYWLPALLEMKYSNVFSQIGGGANFRDHFVCIQQLWDSPWGFGGSIKGCLDGLSFKIGKLHVVLSLIAIAFMWIISLRRKNKLVFLIFLGFIISVFFTLEISKQVWEAIHFMAFFQYPWRFLILISFFSSYLVGSFFCSLRKFPLMLYPGALFVLFLLIFFNLKLFAPQNFVAKNSSDYTNDPALKWKTSRISDEYMPKDFIKPKSEETIIKNKLVVQDGSLKITKLSEKTQKIIARLYVLEEATIRINTAYFPSWNVFVDGKDTPFKITNNGLIISLTQGEHVLEVQFKQTPIEKIANILSLAGITFLILGIISKRLSVLL